MERGKGGYGKAVDLKLPNTFTFYTKRKIDYIIRLKTDEKGEIVPIKATTSGSGKKSIKAVKYKLKMAMNLRTAANANKGTKVLFQIPRGAVLTVLKSSGTWKQVNYCGIVGWVNCSSQYATKL